MAPRRVRLVVAAELGRTTLVAVGGSVALFGLLGGGQLLLRAKALTAALIGAGGAMGTGLLGLALWGVWRTSAAVQLVQPAVSGPGSPAHLRAQTTAAVARAVRQTQLLPYCLAVGFLCAGVGGGLVAVACLGGLRSEDRVLATLLWGFCCGVAALGLVLRLRSFIAPAAQALQARAPYSVRPLLSVRTKLLCGFGWLLLCVTALSLLKQLLLGQVEGHGEGQVATLGLRGLLRMLPVQVAAAGGVVALAVVGLAWPVRDLLRRALAVVGEERGALQRPIVLGVSATAEVVELQRLFEQLRRLLLSRLRSSTEQNLQLEAEVARRTGELSRRNEELSDALVRLQSARAELVQAEKLATVGRIAAGITGEIDGPVNRMADFSGQLAAAVPELLASLADAPTRAVPPQVRERALHSLAELTDGATRVRDIVRAMRVYIRPGETQTGSWDVADVLEDVRQLFGEPLRQAIKVQRAEPAAVGTSQVVTVRSDLALLLASWLFRVEPRLRHCADPQVVLRTRLVDVVGPAQQSTVCEITLWDNGQPLSKSELSEPVGPELLRRLGAVAAVCSGTRSGAWETVLTVRLPAGPTAPLPES